MKKDCYFRLTFSKIKFNKIILNKLISFLFVVVCIITSFQTAIFGDTVVNSITGSIVLKDVQIISKDNKSIKGTIKLSNQSPDYITELWASIEVYMVVDKASNLVGKKYFPVLVDGNNSLDIPFEYTLQSNLYKKDYFIVTNILNRTGVPISSPKKTDLGQLGDNSNFLVYNPENLQLVKSDGTKVSPLEGPLYKPGQEPVFKISFVNTAQSPLKAYAKIDVYERSRMYSKFKPVFSTKSGAFAFDGNKKITDISIKLPKMDKPESYFAEVTMIDNAGKPVSYKIEARYVIEGMGAKIINCNAKVDNGQIIMNTLLVGSADGSLVKGAKVKVSVLDSKNKEIAKNEKEIDLGSDLSQYNLNITVNMTTEKLKVITTIEKNNKILDSNEVVYDVTRMIKNSKNPGNATQSTFLDYSNKKTEDDLNITDSNPGIPVYIYIIVGLVIVFGVAGIWIYMKKEQVFDKNHHLW